jgi:site-specific DNA-methyltransferase (adenine-specific)
LIEPLIKAGCPKDGIVLDPFNGSGTTMLVARNLGRSAIGIDVNPIYSEIVKKRLQWGMGLDIEHEIIEKVLS